MVRVSAIMISVSFLSIATGLAQSREYPPKLDGAKVEVYKTIDDAKLNAYIYFPPDHQATVRRPAIVFFFGGSLGYLEGEPTIP